MSDGGYLSTKGMAGFNPGSTPAVIPVPVPAPGTIGVAVTQASVVIVVPTGPNLCLLASENIVDNLRQGQAANLTLPSLYKRAYMAAYETDEIALTKQSS